MRVSALNQFPLVIVLVILAFAVQTAYAELEQVSVPFPPPYELDCTYSVGDYLIFNCLWRSPLLPANVTAQLEALNENADILPDDEYEASRDKIIMSWFSPVTNCPTSWITLNVSGWWGQSMISD